MTGAVGDGRRAVVLWGCLAALVLVLFGVTVRVLDSTVYSAGGFVSAYLKALDSGDAAGALAMAGVQATAAPGDALLGISERGMLGSIRQESDARLPDGSHRVTVAFVPKGSTAPRHVAFTVRSSGTVGGVFTAWHFVAAPTAFVDVTPKHDARFTANGVQVTTKGADLATRYTVLAPSVLALSHSTTYLTASTVTAVASTVGGVASAAVDVEPRAGFTEKVRTDVASYLQKSCLTQHVLLPTGCPFGEEVNDRLTSTPTWTMTTYPAVVLEPTATTGVWQVKDAVGSAHLKVGAQSLYDGHDYTVDENVAFDVTYIVSIGSDDGLTIKPQ